MTIIQRGLIGTRHVRATLAFDGSTVGDVGTDTIFAITGRVWLLGFTAFCTESLTEGGATATAEVGTATDINGLIVQTIATAIDINEWWFDATPLPGLVQMDALQIDALLSEDIILTTGSQTISNGTIIFDAWYIPITDNGALA